MESKMTLQDGLQPARPYITPQMPEDPRDLQHEILRLRDQLIEKTALLAECEIHIARLQRIADGNSHLSPEDHVSHLITVVDDLSLQIASLHASWSWRIGQAVLSPLRLARRWR